MSPILARMKRWSYAWKTWMGCTKPGGSTLHSGRSSGMCSKRHCIRRPEAWEGDDRKDEALPQNLWVDEAQLRHGKRDRPSRLHPRIARKNEGDARVKAGGAVEKHPGGWSHSGPVSWAQESSGFLSLKSSVKLGPNSSERLFS